MLNVQEQFTFSWCNDFDLFDVLFINSRKIHILELKCLHFEGHQWLDLATTPVKISRKVMKTSHKMYLESSVPENLTYVMKKYLCRPNDFWKQVHIVRSTYITHFLENPGISGIVKSQNQNTIHIQFYIHPKISNFRHFET